MRNYLGDSKFSRKVIISTNNDPNYYFFMPIVAKLWNKMEYTPFIYLFVDQKEWETDKKKRGIIDQTLRAGGNIALVDTKEISKWHDLDGYEVSMMAQVSRLLPSFLPIEKNDYCLTSDIDMLPLNSDYFKQQDFQNKKIHLFYANGYNHTRYPICYIGMNVETWKDVMKVSKTTIYEELIEQVKGLPPWSDKYTQWNHDELLFFKNISNHNGYPNICHMIDREIIPNKGFRNGMHGVPKLLPAGRLDRSYWHFNGSLRNLVDAHCKRPGYLNANWKEIKAVISNLLSKEEIVFFEKYHLMFTFGK